MLKNLWSRIELHCMTHHVPMYVYSGAATPFYACPKYMKKDEEHPDGHDENERGCANRASFDDVMHLVEKFGKQIAEDESQGNVVDYTGLKLKWKTVDAVITKYSADKIIMEIKNRREIAHGVK